MPEPQTPDPDNFERMIQANALAIGRKAVGRDLTPEEANAMTAIFSSAAQALRDGFIERLAAHVLAERRDD